MLVQGHEVVQRLCVPAQSLASSPGLVRRLGGSVQLDPLGRVRRNEEGAVGAAGDESAVVWREALVLAATRLVERGERTSRISDAIMTWQ